MNITARKFGLQPGNNLEAIALLDAIDMAIDEGDSSDPAALTDLVTVRGQLAERALAAGASAATWGYVIPPQPSTDETHEQARFARLGGSTGGLITIELSPAALELVALALKLLADWVDDPECDADDRGLTSTQIRELAGLIDAWLLLN